MMKHLMKRITAAGCAGVMLALGAAELPALTGLAASGVVINEICSKNTTAAASDGKFYDYVELYNSSSAAVSLSGWGLSDQEASPYAYQFPAGTTIGAGEYLVIWCGIDSKSGVDGAPFGLSKKGDTVLLTTADGKREDTVTAPPLDDDTAYGRVPDGSDTLAVISALSAGKSNPKDAVTQLTVDAPTFSKGSGFYNAGFDLTLSAKSGCTIYYTTDGSDPTTASAQYSGAIKVYDKTSEANVFAAKTGIADSYTPPTDPVDKAMIVRAIAVDGQGNVSKIATNSYFIGYSDGDYAMNMRVLSLVTDPENLFNYETGIYVQGKVRDDWRNGPDYDPMTESYFQPANYTQKGREWERPADLTVFESGEATYSVPVGIRIHGGATRSHAQKSLNLYARSDYGATKIEYDFFDGRLRSQATGEAITSFDSMTLRNGGNDNDLKLRDRLNQELMTGRDCAVLAQTECVVFIDGEFWGLYNLMEKPSAEYISDHYGVKEKQVCRIKIGELSDGSEQGLADYEAFTEWAENADYTADGIYEKFTSLVDPKSFADMMAAEVIVANTDFGDNNYSLWKTESVSADNPYADGRWRFILFDTEYGQGLYGSSNANSSILQSLRQKRGWISKLFYGLMDNVPEFRDLFVTAYYDLCNENFSAQNATTRLDELTEAYKVAGGLTLKRFSSSTGGWGGFPGWGGGIFPGFPGADPTDPTDSTDYTAKYTSSVQSLRTYWNSRAEQAKQQMASFVSKTMSSQTCTVQLTNNKSMGKVVLNTLTLNYDSWSGTYLIEEPITLTALPNTGIAFAGWKITGAEITSGTAAAKTITIQPSGGQVTIQADYKVSDEITYSEADVQKLLAYLLKKGTLTETEAASYDLDGSETLTAADLTLLKRRVM